MTVKAEQSMSFGEMACGVDFNPDGNSMVAQCKREFADIIDAMNNLRNDSVNYEVKRMLSIAITEAQSAQMWAVKAITWKY